MAMYDAERAIFIARSINPEVAPYPMPEQFLFAVAALESPLADRDRISHAIAVMDLVARGTKSEHYNKLAKSLKEHLEGKLDDTPKTNLQQKVKELSDQNVALARKLAKYTAELHRLRTAMAICKSVTDEVLENSEAWERSLT